MGSTEYHGTRIAAETIGNSTRVGFLEPGIPDLGYLGVLQM
jgi:hypothetical protein